MKLFQRNLAVPAALAVALVHAAALAQVDPSASYFEIDGDYGSVLGEDADQTGYTLTARNVTDGDGGNRHTTYARRQGYRIDVDEAACANWAHFSFSTYMGPSAYRVQCPYPGRRTTPDCLQDPKCDEETRRSEQMLLSDWYTGTDSARYFTLAFRFNTLGTLPADADTGGFIAQWHEGAHGQPPVRLAWAYKNGAYSLNGGVYKDTCNKPRFFTFLFDQPASPGVWYRMLFQVDPGPGWGVKGCELCPTSQGLVRAWMMNAKTGDWELLGEYRGQVGYRYLWTPAPGLARGSFLPDLPEVCLQDPVAVYRTGKELSYQWKVGHYSNESDWVRLDYDNVAVGKRWNNITKNKLIGYKKSVLNLNFDEGAGPTANDRCWLWNGGAPGDPTKDYNNDGSLQDNVNWSNDGVGSANRSLSFTGGYVNVPVDKTDFDFGNYVTVSAWFKTTANAPQAQGLVSIDDDGGVGKLFLARADDRLSFGVRHPDGTYSEVIYNHAPALYADDQWHHVVGTFNRFTDDNRRVKIYIDGERVLQRVGYDKPILRGDTRLVVGRLGAGGSFIGNIDEVNVTNYTMTDADVAALFINTTTIGILSDAPAPR